MLDLFSGTGSVGKVFEKHGYEVISLDNAKRWKATHNVDILKWNYKQYNPGHFDIVVCSPPCTEFSRAKTTAPRDLAAADRLVCRALEIIEYLAPDKWWLENPRYGLLHTREYMARYPFVDADYCQYSDWGYKKPTRFWGSDHLKNITPKTCDGKTCPNLERDPNNRVVGKKHRNPLGGPKLNTTKYKYRIPPSLVEEISGLPCIPRHTTPTSAPTNSWKRPNTLNASTGPPERNTGKGTKGDEKTPQGIVSPTPISEPPQDQLGKGSSGAQGTTSPRWVVKPTPTSVPAGLERRDSWEVGKIRELQDNRKQLLLHLRARTIDGKKLTLRALVDTGAVANLLCKGLLPPRPCNIHETPWPWLPRTEPAWKEEQRR